MPICLDNQAEAHTALTKLILSYIAGGATRRLPHVTDMPVK